MTALSIINMRQSQRYHNELNSNAKLNMLERLAVRLQVARSLQKQTGYQQIIFNGEAMEANVLKELLTICDTDPAHIARAVDVQYLVDHAGDWQDEAAAQMADALDWMQQTNELRAG